MFSMHSIYFSRFCVVKALLYTFYMFEYNNHVLVRSNPESIIRLSTTQKQSGISKYRRDDAAVLLTSEPDKLLLRVLRILYKN